MNLAPVVFDPFSDDFFDDPTDTYRRLRNEAPVYFNDTYGFYALSRYTDVLAAHRDWHSFSSEHGVDLSSLTKDHEFIKSLGMMIMMDPPGHNRFRNLVGRVFSPRAVTALEPMIRDVIVGLLDDLAERDSFDVVAEFSALFPIEVISRMLGVPEGERQQIRHWIDLMLHREPGEMDPTPEGQAAALDLIVYFHELSRAKRIQPNDDMLSELTQVTVEREEGGDTALTDNEIAGFAGLLGGAGAETVTKLIGNAAVLFDRHPEEWCALTADASLIPDAIEEILRLLPPSQYQGRFCVRERELDSGTIPAGYPVLLVTGAAMRDPRAFEDPDAFDIRRPRSQGLAFGQGVHICLGAALARLESQIAIEELTRRWTRLEVDTSGLRRVSMSNVAGFSSVPVTAVR